MIGIAAAVLLFLLVATILPVATTQVFASPDETAVAAFARGWTWDKGFSLWTNLSLGLDGMTGLHPRSMVQQGARLMPVGFLGMPMLILPFEKVVEGSGAFLTALLVLSSAFALFRLAEAFGRRAAWTSVIVYLTFPTVLLYTNRGLFPNLPVVALGIWAMWLLQQNKKWMHILGGMVIGLALTIRPIEALWLLPWIAWIVFRQKEKQRFTLAGMAAAVVCVIGYVSAVQTYGHFLFPVGYWLHDVTLSELVAPVPTVRDLSGPTLPSLPSILPFGIHPRGMWNNIQSMLFGILGPWVAASLAGYALWMWRHRAGTRQSLAPTLLTGWTVVVLLVMYGQARYTDNINGTATLGNSFLRYLLPLVPLMAIAIGLLAEELSKIAFRWRVAAIGLTIFFAVFGTVTALVRDEESIIPTRMQLERYMYIREVVQHILEPGSIILSERSDKIFVGLPYVSVSPMPSSYVIRIIQNSSQPSALFHRLLTDEQRATFADGAYQDWWLANVFENEGIYIPPFPVATP
jgi:hypothetical protein